MKSLQGRFLVAATRLHDPNFFKSVVLLIQHGKTGALGLVLNRPLDTLLKSAWEQVSEAPCQYHGFLHQGGPCEGPLMALHGDSDLSEIEVLPDVHFCTDRDKVESLVGREGGSKRFFVGYSGWAAGQLEGELDQGGWLHIPATPQLVFSDPVDLWNVLMKLIRRESAPQWLDRRIIPDDPSVN